MGFFSKVARDIQVIISDGGGKKRQRFNPKKRRPKGKFVRKPTFQQRMEAKYGDRGTSMNTQDSARDPGTSRDFADELRHLSVQALGRLLLKAYRSGDDAKCSAIEREIDRRGKGAMLSRYSRRR